MNFIIRIYSFLFLLPLTLFFFAIGSFAYIDGRKELTFDMLPWSEANIRMWIFGLSLFGLISILLAAKHMLRVFYAMYGVIVLSLVFYAVFLSRYVFDGTTGFYWGLGLCGGALLAAWGAILHSRKQF